MPETLEFTIDRIPSPLGELAIVTDERERLRSVHWTDGDDAKRVTALLSRQYGPGAFELRPARGRGPLSLALAGYFGGDLAAIDGLPVETRGTPFQRDVWSALREIQCGTTISYGELARRVGRPAAVRAVGMANHNNPVGIVTPCHRVIGHDGGLTGYGGGLDRKRWLLAHEGVPGISKVA